MESGIVLFFFLEEIRKGIALEQQLPALIRSPQASFRGPGSWADQAPREAGIFLTLNFTAPGILLVRIRIRRPGDQISSEWCFRANHDIRPDGAGGLWAK